MTSDRKLVSHWLYLAFLWQAVATSGRIKDFKGNKHNKVRLKDWELKRVVVGFGTEDAYQLQGCPEEMGRDHRKKVLRGNRGVLKISQMWFLTKII